MTGYKVNRQKNRNHRLNAVLSPDNFKDSLGQKNLPSALPMNVSNLLKLRFKRYNNKMSFGNSSGNLDNN